MANILDQTKNSTSNTTPPQNDDKPMTYNSITSGITSDVPTDRSNPDKYFGNKLSVQQKTTQPINPQNVTNIMPSPPIAVSPKVDPNQQSSSSSTQGDELLTDKEYPEDLDSQWTKWKCMKCGYVYEGIKPLYKCPRCQNDDPDKFDDPY